MTRPTIRELEALLERKDLVVEIQPNGEVRAVPKSPWQLIETAPKDGARIDLWANGRKTDCRWSEALGHWCRDGGHNEGYSYAIRVDNPTHWMPLPELPSQAAALGEP